MKRYLLPALLLLAGLPAPPRTEAQTLRRHEFSSPHMGTLFRLVLYTADDSLAKAAAETAFARVAALDACLSDYRADSELSRISRFRGPDTTVVVSNDLWAVCTAARQVSERSGGAFDLTVGPLSKLWRRAFRQREFPDSARLAAAKAAVGYRCLELLEGRRVRLARPGMQLDAGGIAKGYAVDEAMAVLHRFGISSALVDGGGDLRVSTRPPDAAGWRVLAPGRDSSAPLVLLAENVALATSGDTYRYLEWQGRRYAHIIDPRSGLGLTHRAIVSVSCPDATTADALASAISVIGPRGRWRKLLRRYPGCSAQVLYPGRRDVLRHDGRIARPPHLTYLSVDVHPNQQRE